MRERQRHVDQTRPRPEPAAPAHTDLGSKREAVNHLEAVAHAVFNRVKASDSEAFLVQSRQSGGQ